MGADAGRERLAGAIDAYFAAVAANDPARLVFDASARFTENGQELELGRGLWTSATGTAPARAVVVPDPDSGQVAGWGMVLEGGADALLGVRLKLDGARIVEAETMVVRRPMFNREAFPDVLRRPSPLFPDVVAADERGDRAALVAAASAYVDGVAGDDADLIPAADECVRVENGLQTTLNLDGSGIPPGFALAEGLSLSVNEQVRRADFRYIEAIRDRRFDVVDETRGLVLLTCFFDHPGQLRGSGYVSPILSPNSMMVWELFKVVGGRIRRIEAILSAFPYGMRSGWS